MSRVSSCSEERGISVLRPAQVQHSLGPSSCRPTRQSTRPVPAWPSTHLSAGTFTYMPCVLSSRPLALCSAWLLVGPLTIQSTVARPPALISPRPGAALLKRLSDAALSPSERLSWPLARPSTRQYAVARPPASGLNGRGTPLGTVTTLATGIDTWPTDAAQSHGALATTALLKHSASALDIMAYRPRPATTDVVNRMFLDHRMHPIWGPDSELAEAVAGVY
jgi:hypothetical protein